MRKIAFQMMTTLNGRLDDPLAWVKSVGDDQYREIERIYATYDTVLVGRTTYEEMAAYWLGAVSEAAGTETNQAMACRMNTYKKVVVATDDELAKYLANLKTQPGGDMHLSGGARFAQSVIALDLVDEFYFFVYPVVSPGASWFSQVPDQRDLQLHSACTYENGVVGLHYLRRKLADRARPDSFSDLLT